MKDYGILLKKYHLKATPQRIYMVNEIEKKGHINIDDLYESLKKSFPYISLATVYKNINAMVENGFLSEVKIPKMKTKYELTKDEHAHLVCIKCGTLEDICIDTQCIKNDIIQKSGYDIEKTLIQIEGICPKCQNNKEK